ncbi:MAG: hypothetical protein R3B54_02940 [Bdellovibrionota bacterium]
MFWDPNLKLIVVLGMGLGLALLRAESDRSFAFISERAVAKQPSNNFRNSPRIEAPVPLPPNSRFDF